MGMCVCSSTSLLKGPECVQTWCNNCGVTASFFELKQAMILTIHENSHFSTKLTTGNNETTLKIKDEIADKSKMLLNKFVPIDNARGNVAFVWEGTRLKF